MSTSEGPEVRIRRAVVADAEAISELIRGVSHFFTLHPEGAGADAFLETIQPPAIRGYLESGDFTCFVAEALGGPSGDLGPWLAGVVSVRGTTHLFHLFVSPDYQRRGIAARLWARAKRSAIRAGNSGGHFSVFSTPFAVPVYERFGFRATGPRQEKDGIAFVPMRLGPAPV